MHELQPPQSDRQHAALLSCPRLRWPEPLGVLERGVGVTQATPAAPSNLAATAVSSSQINLTWTDNATNEGGFKLERSTDGVNFTQIERSAQERRQVLCYRPARRRRRITSALRAYDGPNHSPYSNVPSATTTAHRPPRRNLTATAVSSDRINLTWTDNATNEGGFKLERSTDGVNFSQIAHACREHNVVRQHGSRLLPPRTTTASGPTRDRTTPRSPTWRPRRRRRRRPRLPISQRQPSLPARST